MIVSQILWGSHILWHLKYYRVGLLVKTLVRNLWFNYDSTGIIGGKYI